MMSLLRGRGGEGRGVSQKMTLSDLGWGGQWKSDRVTLTQGGGGCADDIVPKYSVSPIVLMIMLSVKIIFPKNIQ